MLNYALCGILIVVTLLVGISADQNQNCAEQGMIAVHYYHVNKDRHLFYTGHFWVSVFQSSVQCVSDGTNTLNQYGVLHWPHDCSCFNQASLQPTVSFYASVYFFSRKTALTVYCGVSTVRTLTGSNCGSRSTVTPTEDCFCPVAQQQIEESHFNLHRVNLIYWFIDTRPS